MKLQQLKYLLAIADNDLSITTAANQLYTSQPGVSRQLGLLEAELGILVFTRNGRRLTGTTPAGKCAIAHARAIMREVDAIRKIARELSRQPETNRRAASGG